MKPRRIQLRRTKGWRMPLNTVKVDRSTQWGNVYRAGLFRNFTAADAVDSFRSRLEENLHHDARVINADIFKLRGKNLACWCPLDQPCHADVLLELANMRPGPCPEKF
jgi:hypothetical protein